MLHIFYFQFVSYLNRYALDSVSDPDDNYFNDVDVKDVNLTPTYEPT